MFILSYVRRKHLNLTRQKHQAKKVLDMKKALSKRVVCINNQTKLLLLIFTLSILINTNLFSQENEFKNSSIRTGVGLGINQGEEETGIGLAYTIGWQKSYGKKNRIRLNPNIILGSYRTYAIPTDTRDQLYKITTLGYNIHYDLIKAEAVSIIVTAGSFINYSRGLLGTGGWSVTNNNSSEYFHSFYYGANISLGFRVNPKKSKFAYEFRPMNIHIGNNGFILGYLMFGIDFKLK